MIILFVCIIVLIGCAKIDGVEIKTVSANDILFPNLEWCENNKDIMIVEYVETDEEAWKKHLEENDANPDSVAIYIGHVLNIIHFVEYLEGYEKNPCVRNHECGHIREQVEGYEHHTKYALGRYIDECPEPWKGIMID